MGISRAWLLTLDSRDPRAVSSSWVPQAEGREREPTMQQAGCIYSFLSIPQHPWEGGAVNPILLMGKLSLRVKEPFKDTQVESAWVRLDQYSSDS